MYPPPSLILEFEIEIERFCNFKFLRIRLKIKLSLEVRIFTRDGMTISRDENSNNGLK